MIGLLKLKECLIFFNSRLSILFPTLPCGSVSLLYCDLHSQHK